MVRSDPNVLNLISSMGGNPSFGGSLNQGRMFFRLKDKKDRVNHATAMDVIQELRPSWRRCRASTSSCRFRPPYALAAA